METPTTTQEVADRFYTLAQQGAYDQIQEELYDAQVLSLEPDHAPGPSRVEGMEGIRQKAQQWQESIEQTYGGYCEAPIVAGKTFACAMGMDVEMKGQGRVKMDELAVYQVNDQGKIILEQFFY